LVEYIRGKSGKITGVVWDDSRDYGTYLAVGGVIIALAVTGIAWWQTRRT